MDTSAESAPDPRPVKSAVTPRMATLLKALAIVSLIWVWANVSFGTSSWVKSYLGPEGIAAVDAMEHAEAYLLLSSSDENYRRKNGETFPETTETLQQCRVLEKTVLDKTQRARLREVLLAAKSYSNSEEGIKRTTLCAFNANMAYKIQGNGQTVYAIVCFGCGKLAVTTAPGINILRIEGLTAWATVPYHHLAAQLFPAAQFP